MKSLPDLDEAIRRAERAVVERDRRVRHEWLALGDATVAARAKATRGVGWSAAVGAGLLLLWRALPRFRRDAARAAPAVAAAAVPVLSAAPIASAWRSALRILPVLWPLMPATVLKRAPARLVVALAGLAAPQRARRGAVKAEERAALAVAGLIDPQRFAGRWYEIARLPDAADAGLKRDIKAEYRAIEKIGKAGPTVKAWAVTRRGRRSRNGNELSLEGVARPHGEGGKWRLTFAPRWLRWLPLAWADHWILHVDPGYRTALVGTPDRRRLWLLSRTPRLEANDERRLADRAQAWGFPTGRLQHTPQRWR